MAATLAKILRDLDRQVHWFDLDQNGLAEKAMDIAVDCMLRDMDNEQDPDGNNWPDLSENYGEWKSKYFPGHPMAVLHGIMKTKEELRGLDRVTPLKCTMVYGTSEEAREEAEWFQEGDAQQDRPPRRFWGFSVEALTRTDQMFERRLGEI